jgi:hypothetical protein
MQLNINISIYGQLTEDGGSTITHCNIAGSSQPPSTEENTHIHVRRPAKQSNRKELPATTRLRGTIYQTPELFIQTGLLLSTQALYSFCSAVIFSEIA